MEIPLFSVKLRQFCFWSSEMKMTIISHRGPRSRRERWKSIEKEEIRPRHVSIRVAIKSRLSRCGDFCKFTGCS